MQPLASENPRPFPCYPSDSQTFVAGSLIRQNEISGEELAHVFDDNLNLPLGNERLLTLFDLNACFAAHGHCMHLVIQQCRLGICTFVRKNDEKCMFA